MKLLNYIGECHSFYYHVLTSNHLRYRVPLILKPNLNWHKKWITSTVIQIDVINEPVLLSICTSLHKMNLQIFLVISQLVHSVQKLFNLLEINYSSYEPQMPIMLDINLAQAGDISPTRLLLITIPINAARLISPHLLLGIAPFRLHRLVRVRWR